MNIEVCNDLDTWAFLSENNIKHVFSAPQLPAYLGAVKSLCDYNTLLWEKNKEQEEKSIFWRFSAVSPSELRQDVCLTSRRMDLLSHRWADLVFTSPL